MTAEEYRNYLETDFDDVDLKELKDIRKIRIDRNKTKEKRIAQYLRQVGNPYLVCIGNVKVKIRFANNGVSFGTPQYTIQRDKAQNRDRNYQTQEDPHSRLL